MLTYRYTRIEKKRIYINKLIEYVSIFKYIDKDCYIED